MGENGAGKSTLVKILSGVHPEHDGQILLDGAPARLTGVRDAERHGIAIIHQELNLVPELTVAENILLGREPLPLGLLARPAGDASAARASCCARLGLDLDPDATVGGCAWASSSWSRSRRRSRSTPAS